MSKTLDHEEFKKTLIDFYNEMEKKRIDRTGYIFLPIINGFEVFEISEDHLKKFLTIEGMVNRFNKSINELE